MSEKKEFTRGMIDPEMPASQMRLVMGEMTEQEVRTARAAIVWANSAILNSGTASPDDGYQERVSAWLFACFGEEIARNRTERSHRFLEEALELVQALGCSRSEAMQIVGYVYDREAGEPRQEVGGVMMTLAALCFAQGFDMMADGETELARVWTKIEKIRRKQAAKPKHCPLPEHQAAATVDTVAILAAIEPVHHWYQSDELPDRPVEDILRDLAADLRDDRESLLRLRRRRAIRVLSNPGSDIHQVLIGDTPVHVLHGRGEAGVAVCRKIAENLAKALEQEADA